MTNDEAMYYLGIIYERSKNGKRPYHTIYQDAFDMAIEALRTQDLPSAQPEHRLSCKNCIHLGHGYMMPCKNCKRNQTLPDWYEV